MNPLRHGLDKNLQAFALAASVLLSSNAANANLPSLKQVVSGDEQNFITGLTEAVGKGKLKYRDTTYNFETRKTDAFSLTTIVEEFTQIKNQIFDAKCYKLALSDYETFSDYGYVFLCVAAFDQKQTGKTDWGTFKENFKKGAQKDPDIKGQTIFVELIETGKTKCFNMTAESAITGKNYKADVCFV